MSAVVEKKTEVAHDDYPEKVGEGDVQLKSTLDRLSFWQAVSVYRKTVGICFIAAFCAATDGYQNQVAASIIANRGFINQFGFFATATATAKSLKAEHVSSFGGIFSAGQVIGQFSMQWVSDRWGRKAAMYAFMALLTIAAIVETVSTVWWHWTIAKLIGGIGIGSVQASLPVYINEHSPAQMRGFLIVAYSAWFSIGGLMGSIALKVHRDNKPLDWKTPILTQFAMIGFSLIIFFFLPESPWWLASKGKYEEAQKILDMKYKNVEGYDTQAELAIIVATIGQQQQWARESQNEGPFAILKGLDRKRFLIGSWPKVLQQFIGLSIFSSYSVFFFQQAVSTIDPFLVGVILGCVSIVAVVVDACLVDFVGRRRMTLIGFTGASSGITLMAILGCLKYQGNASLGSALVFAGVLANFCNTFQSSTSYAYLTECSQQRFKARATGWGLAYCNLYAIIFNFTVPLMLKKWQVKTAFLFVALGVPGTIASFWILPETAMRSPAEIEEMFQDRVPLTKWRGHVTRVERDLDEAEGVRHD